MTEIAFVVSLIVAPPFTPSLDIEQKDWLKTQSAAWTVAINLEIMDSRETQFIFANFFEHKSDLDILRKRYQDLKDVPSIKDAERFPNHKEVMEMIYFNRAFRGHVEKRMWLEKDRTQLYQSILNETDYSEREYNATLENYRNEIGHYRSDLPDGWESHVYSYFSDTNQCRYIENRDDQGGWAPREALVEALIEMGVLQPEEE